MAVYYMGISFPFRRGASALPVQATDDDLIKQSIIQIIMTKRGERVMRPDFGTNIISFIFENSDPLLEELIRTEVFGAIGRYEPRVVLTNVLVARSDTTVDVTVVYVVIATGATGSVGASFLTP